MTHRTTPLICSESPESFEMELLLVIISKFGHGLKCLLYGTVRNIVFQAKYSIDPNRGA